MNRAAGAGTALGGGYHIIARPEGFADTAAAFLARKLGAIPGDTTCNIALSGGTTPRPVYEALAREALPRWDRVRVFFADERAVPPDDDESNYRLVRESLIDRLPQPPEFYRMPADSRDLERAAEEYEALLPDRLDMLVLGLGEDGHTASLFPGATESLESGRRVVPVVAPVEPDRRLSITPVVIARARLVVVLVAGARKTEAVRRVLFEPGPAAECPGRLARRGVWIIATDALPRGERAP